MSTHAIEAADSVPTAYDHAPLVNIDPDFHLPTGQGNGYVRAFRVLFPKSA